jgi:pimeloyl-ACP methyl ester carboxylesterase
VPPAPDRQRWQTTVLPAVRQLRPSPRQLARGGQPNDIVIDEYRRALAERHKTARRARHSAGCGKMTGMPPTRRPARALPRRSATLTAAALSCAAMMLAGCSSASSPGPGSVPATKGTGGARAGQVAVHRLDWQPCTISSVSQQCASLRVPLDYARPSGRKITLALSMVPASAPPAKQLGDLLVNPGGPGASGRYLAAQVALSLDRTVASRYNVIGFDPRGVGASVPALTCDPSFFAGVRPDYIPASQAAEQALLARARAYAADCERRFGWLLPYMNTEDQARDMDSIRAALGQQKISYLGYSYGTYLGQVYATLFGSRVRRMVLDSTVNPRGAWYADNIAQDYAFEGRIQAFFAWIAAHAATYQLGSTRAEVQRAWYRARAELAAHPIAGPSGPMMGPAEYDDTMSQGSYLDTLWPPLAAALAAYLHTGSTSGLLGDYKAFGTQNENLFAVYNAVECSDVAWPRNWAKWDADTRRVYRTAPFEAWDNAWFNAACAFWPVHGPARPPAIKGAGLPPILMIQGSLDPATPYQGAQAAHKLLPSARMVVVEGSGNHGQSLQAPPNLCANNYVNDYLATGAVPQHPGLVNATCPALPLPSPNG